MKVAIVTGAAQGIGRRTAEVLASAGYSLALLDLKSCESTLARVRTEGADAEEFLGDVSDENIVAKAVSCSSRALGQSGCTCEQRRHQLYRAC